MTNKTQIFSAIMVKESTKKEVINVYLKEKIKRHDLTFDTLIREKFNLK